MIKLIDDMVYFIKAQWVVWVSGSSLGLIQGASEHKFFIVGSLLFIIFITLFMKFSEKYAEAKYQSKS